jgi:hypothetical protein
MGEPVEVYAFGFPEELIIIGKFKLHKNISIHYNVGTGEKLSQHMVEIFNEKLGYWQCYPCNEALLDCPVCGRPMRVYYVPGSTWLALCSKECTEKFDAKVQELGDIHRALEHFEREAGRNG